MDAKLHNSLQLAGENREELQKVLDHYSAPADSLKRRAARFLIANMSAQYTYRGKGLTFRGNGRSSYEVFVEKLGRIWGADRSHRSKKKLTWDLYDELQISEATRTLRLTRDVTYLTGQYLIANIDQAFSAWRSYPWSQQVSFEDFCNYILPYKVYGEPPERWRKKIRTRFSWVVDSLEDSTSLREVTRLINRQLKSQISYCKRMVAVPTALRFSDLEKASVGKCDHMVTYNVYVLRALGIPAHVDFVPVWANQQTGHTWISVKDEQDKLYAFDAMYPNASRGQGPMNTIPTIRVHSKERAPKVFRLTYRIQPNPSGYDTIAAAHIPRLFADRNRIDVTQEYDMPVADLPMRADPGYTAPFAYLSVFNGNRWSVTAQGKRDARGRYNFDDLGAGVLYLPVSYKNHAPRPISYPLIVGKQDKLRLLDPNMDQTRPIRIDRKYPLRPYVKESLQNMVGGVFEGSNRRDFRDARPLYTISEMPRPKTNRYSFDQNGPFRYLRFRLPNQVCRVAELQFMTAKPGYSSPFQLEGRLISSIHSEEGKPEHITDDNVLSYFVATADSGGWVGVDLGEKQRVSGVQFYPPNDGNSVETGDEYKLFYWDYGWKSYWPKRRAKGEELVFENAPTNALFILRNLTKGQDERIFTYEDGQQVWW